MIFQVFAVAEDGGVRKAHWMFHAVHGRPEEIGWISTRTASGSFLMRRLDWSGFHLWAMTITTLASLNNQESPLWRGAGSR